MKYTEEIVKDIVDEYLKAPNQETIKALCEKHDLLPRSLIAKLSTLGVYQKQGYRTKSGQPPVKKAVYADQLGALLGLEDFEIEQLEKLTKALLQKMILKIDG